MQIGLSDVSALARGCAVLGSGGGGAVRDAALLLEKTLAECGPVSVVEPDAMAGAELTALVGAVGSPTVMLELLPGSDEFVSAARKWEAYVDGRLSAVTTLEIGGVNGLLAVNVAARLGLPILDADAMGRAFPRLSLTILADTIDVTPLVLADARGGTMVLDGIAANEVDEAIRRMLPTFGTWAAVCSHGCTIAEMGVSAVPGSITRAIGIGKALDDNPEPMPDPTPDQTIGVHGMIPLFTGTVIEVLRARGAEPGGVVTMRGLVDPQATLRVDFLDEFLIAAADGHTLAYAPDVIALLDRYRRPVLVDEVRTGQRLTLLRVPAPAELVRAGRRLGLAAYAMTDVSHGVGSEGERA